MKRENRHEFYLIAFALVLLSGLILFNAYGTPEVAAVNISDGTYATSFEQAVTQSTTVASSASGEESTYEEKIQLDATTAPATKAQKSAGGILNLNTASEQEFSSTLDGVGSVKAAAIVEYRNENGGFKSIEEIMNVKGIGEKTFDKIKNKITV